MGLIDLTADLTYNSNFETEPVQNQTGPEVNSNFQTSELEDSPTEEIGSVNFFSDDLVAGFTQFMDYPNTLYPSDGLDNSGIVDHFPNPHNYDGDTAFQIEGFTANMPKYETLYPLDGLNNSGIVDFLPSPHGIGHFGVNDVPHDIEGFVPNVQPLSDGFYPNTIQLGSVDFIPGGNFSNNFLTSTGFTQNAEPFGGNKIETEFLMVGGEDSLNQDFMGNELFQSINTLGTYKGAVNFISDSDSYATGFTKNMQPIGGDKLDTQYDVSTYYTDKELTFSGITQGTPSPGLSQYVAGLESQFTTLAEEPSSDVTWSLQIPAAGLGDTAPPYTIDQLKTNLPSMGIDTSGYDGAVNFFSNDDAVGFTKNMYAVGESKLPSQYNLVPDENAGGAPSPSVTTYGISTDSIFTTDVANVTTNPEFSVYTLGDFQLGKVAGMGERGEDPFSYTDLLGTDTAPGMMSWNVDGFTYDQFTSKVGTNSFGKTSYGIGDYESFLGIPTGEDGTIDDSLIHLDKGVFGSGFSSDNGYSYEEIPSLSSVPKPDYTAVSGPFSSNSGLFGDGDFKLGLTSTGTTQTIQRYLQSGLTGNANAVEGSIVEDVTTGLVRSGVTTLGTKLENGDTIFRDIKDMGGMAQTPYSVGYGDGINNGWMKGLIDTSIKDTRDYSGHSADFFIRESGGGRFLGRIVKDLSRLAKWQFSTNGLLSLAKNGIMTFFNPSEKSLQLNTVAQFTAAAGNMFGIRPTSAFSGILDLVTNAIFAKDRSSLLYYETRVEKPHPKIGNAGQTFLNNLNPLPAGDLDGGRTLLSRYGAPAYPERGRFGITKPKRAHELYARGFRDRTEGHGFNAIDFINIKGYDDSSPDEYGDVKDLIKFYIRDLRNGKILRFRAFINGITDAITPQYNPYKFLGRPDEVYTYKGTSRAVSFNLKVAAMSRHEMYPMWEKLNYLVGLGYGSYAETKTDGQYAQVNPGMSAPITMLTLGDYFVDQPGYIKDLSITVGDSPWDVIIDDEGKNAVGELPQSVDVNIGYQIIPQQIPDSYGKHFGKVGTQDLKGADGLPWLPDMYMNDGVSAVERFENLGGETPEPAESKPDQEPEDTTNSDNATGKGEQTAQDAASNPNTSDATGG